MEKPDSHMFCPQDQTLMLRNRTLHLGHIRMGHRSVDVIIFYYINIHKCSFYIQSLFTYITFFTVDVYDGSTVASKEVHFK